MAREVRRHPVLQRRLDSLNREIDGVRQNLRRLNKEIRKPGAIEALSRVTQDNEAPAVPSPTERPDASNRNSGARPVVGASPPSVPDAESGMAQPLVREHDRKFANYFVTGSFHGIRPLRQEQRKVRNQAIFLLVIVFLLLFWVISLLL